MSTAKECEEKIAALQWDGLRSLWEKIKNSNTSEWEPGKAFEYLVLRAFQLDGAKVKFPYNVKLFNTEIEQIDGAVHYSGLYCLVESKDRQDKVDIAPIAKLRNQLLRRPAGTIGLVFSRIGFTNPAINLSHFLSPQTILLWNGEEIEYALKMEKICELLVLKYRICVEEGIPDYDIREESIV